MSREIKFRVWDKDLKKMHICGENQHDSISFSYPENEAHYYNLQNGCGSSTDGSGTYELMQYTGLKDKNGMEIYEGDIIYWEINNGVGIESYTAIVKWSEDLVEEGWNQTYKWLVGYTGNYYRGSYDELSTPAAYNEALQVIGNIYENPELLEATA